MDVPWTNLDYVFVSHASLILFESCSLNYGLVLVGQRKITSQNYVSQI